MATLNQERAFKRVSEQVGKSGKISVSKAMRGIYSPSVAKNPKKLTESKGFQELMDDSGLTDDLLLDALVDDIKGKPKKRFKELELGFKVRARLNPEGTEALKAQSITNNITQIIINAPHASDVGNKSHRETVPSVASPSES